jgi:hypothetical protein
VTSARVTRRTVRIPIWLPFRDPQERRDLLQCAVGIAPQILARENEQLLSWEELEPALELLRVVAAGNVGAPPVVRPHVARIVGHSRELERHLELLACQRVLERERFPVLAYSHLVLRVRALDGITQNGDQPHPRIEAVHACRDLRVEEVARSHLADRGLDAEPAANRPGARLEREVHEVPGGPLKEVDVEVVHFLRGRADDRRVVREVPVQ